MLLYLASRAKQTHTQIIGVSSKRKAAPKSSSFVRKRNISIDGKLSTNHRGRPLCVEWQTGSCTDTHSDGLCANDPSKSHHCSVCLSHNQGNG
eukprot:4878622-Amphidinium_carterae.1